MDAAAITAIGIAIAAIITAAAGAWVNITNSRAARQDAAESKAASARAEAAATAAHDQSVTTAKAVDGQTSKLIDAVSGKVAAEATLAERDAAHVRTGEAAIVAAAVVANTPAA